MIKLLILQQAIQELCIVFVDDTDFFLSREDAKQIIENKSKEYELLFEAMGRKIQFQKIFYFGWRQSWKNGQKVINQINFELKVNEVRITQVEIHTRIRLLGVQINPVQDWTE